MDIQTIWIIALSAATPIAGIVGFAIQLRMVKKTRLENEKLQLEIARLKKEAEKADRRVVSATTDQVLRFGRGMDDDARVDKRTVRISDLTRNLMPFGYYGFFEWFSSWLGRWTIPALVLISAQLLFDLYLMGRWIWRMF